ncbi:tRNA 2-selenouridine(34) synthase MnmH [Polynucleobacter sp. IMCC30063]|nr:tRNA 2-selenouridine(34) synthase MnmH [Polynucleobacter sp. IMCC30063]
MLLEPMVDFSQYDAIIDTRSPAEFALDHIPGAINYPVLNNEERARIGTIYKNDSAFAAKKIGAALVARNISAHLENHFLAFPYSWRPLIYCWRGGERSGAFTLILQRIGWKADQLVGGYQAFRRHVISELNDFASQFSFIVICGMTGTGKTRLLAELQGRQLQVLDLEGLAVHRGSVLGHHPEAPQPSQKSFETALWNTLRLFDPSKPVYVESESKKVGGLHIPDPLMARIRAGECIEIQAEITLRVQWLMEQYPHFLVDVPALEAQLISLTARYGRMQIEEWCAAAQAGEFAELVHALLVQHYDTAYQHSIERNFTHYPTKRSLDLAALSPAAFSALADQVLTLKRA